MNCYNLGRAGCGRRDGKKYVRCLSVGDRRNDAAAVSLADLLDDAL